MAATNGVTVPAGRSVPTAPRCDGNGRWKIFKPHPGALRKATPCLSQRGVGGRSRDAVRLWKVHPMFLRALLNRFRSLDVVGALERIGGEETPFSQLKPNTAAENLLLHDETVVFEAIPTHRTYSCQTKSVHSIVPAAELEALQLRLTKIGNEFRWKSRRGIKVCYFQDGRFHYFVDPTAGGHIKIVEHEGQFLFAEQFTESTLSFTYWGTGKVFRP